MNVATATRAENDSTAGDPWELPRGWCWTALGSVASLRREKVSPQAEPTLPFVGMDDIEPDGTSIVQMRSFGSMRSAGNRFYPGDVLYGRLRPYLNKTAVTTSDGASSGELLAIRPSIAVDSRYLQLFMHARRFVNTAMSTVSGDRPRIDFATIAQFNFPLAPLAEQRRIVERVDSLFAQIAEGEAALAAARKGLEIFRRTLLKAAVTGELTKDWRAVNPVSETGHDLLARIAKDRAKAVPAKGRSHRNTTPPLDASALPALPEGWAWATLEAIAAVGTGGTPLRSNRDYWENGSNAWFTSAATNLPFASVPNELITERALLETNCRVYPAGTLLVAMYGEGKTRGQITELAVPAACNQACAALQLANADLREWIKRWFGSFYLQLRAQAAGGVQPNLNLEIIKSLSVPIPPPAEAAEILRRVSDALAAVADVLAIFDAEAADAARLKQSILKAAFEGRLAAQDTADESAGALLAPLKAQNSNRPAAKPAKLKRRGRPEKIKT
jgi:type I restriction enzyme S subunit